MATNMRWPEPPVNLDRQLDSYLRELIRTLGSFDTEVLSEENRHIFRAARIRPFIEVSTGYTVGVNDCVVLADASASSLTINLPTALDVKGTFFTVKRIDAVSVNSVSVEGSGPEFPLVLASSARTSKTVFSDGSRFWVL